MGSTLRSMIMNNSLVGASSASKYMYTAIKKLEEYKLRNLSTYTAT